MPSKKSSRTDDCTIKRVLVACVGCTIGFAASVAPAGECSTAWGEWGDNYGYTWLLGGGSSPSGTVMAGPPPCQFNWDVSGTLSDGTVSLTATNPYWPFPDPEICARDFTYNGYIAPGGCNVAAGEWDNSSGNSGSWVMTKACDIPNGSPAETSHTGAWAGRAHIFIAVVSDPAGGPSRDWSGRRLRERDYDTGWDQCWFEGPKGTHLTP